MTSTNSEEQLADDIGLRALLGLLGPAEEEEEEEGEDLRTLVRDDTPAAVAQFITAVVERGIYVDLASVAGGFELMDPETLAHHNQASAIGAALSAYQISASEVLNLGCTGGGEESLLLGWNPAGYRLFRWDMMEATLKDQGSFAEFFVSLCRYLVDYRESEKEDLEGSGLESVMVAMGAWDSFWSA